MPISHWFKLADAYAFAASHGLTAEAATIKEAPVHQTIKKPHVVKKGYLVELLQSRGLLDQFVQQYWPRRHTPAGEQSYAKYLSQKALNEQLLSGQAVVDDSGEDLDVVDDATSVDAATFVLEAQLRDFIAENLERIPINGHRLRVYVGPDGRRGVEFPTDVGPIDILAKDEADNLFVFELKLERGPDRALGQLARYMGWVKVNLAGARSVFGIVVARSIDERLQYAVCVIPNVTLLEYEVEFRLRNVSLATAESQPNIALEPTARN